MLCERLMGCMRVKPKSSSLVKQPESVDIQTQRPDEIGRSHGKSIGSVRIERVPVKSPENRFVVENLGMMYASWTNTVRIDRKILSEWGGRVEEVEIETVDGRIAQCRVRPMKKPEKRVIQIPDKIQTKLKIKAGESVVVKPLEGSRKETKIRAMITDYALSILFPE